MFPQTTGMNNGGAIGAHAIEKSYQAGFDAHAPQVPPGPSVHGAIGRLEESVDALQKVLTTLGERLMQGGVLSPMPTAADANATTRPAMCGLEERVVGIRMTVDRLAQATVTVVQSLQV